MTSASWLNLPTTIDGPGDLELRQITSTNAADLQSFYDSELSAPERKELFRFFTHSPFPLTSFVSDATLESPTFSFSLEPQPASARPEASTKDISEFFRRMCPEYRRAADHRGVETEKSVSGEWRSEVIKLEISRFS